MSQPTNTRSHAHQQQQGSTPISTAGLLGSNNDPTARVTMATTAAVTSGKIPMTTTVTKHSDSVACRTPIKRSASPRTASPEKKRATADADSIITYKKRNLDYRLARLNVIKEKYSEHVAELFFLQTNGNMMDYAAWRKKANTPEYIHFVKNYRLDQVPIDAAIPVTTTAATITTTTSVTAAIPAAIPVSITTPKNTAANAFGGPSTTHSNMPLGVEIKIAGVGVTPVAVSTTLPAAVAQLSQKGSLSMKI